MKRYPAPVDIIDRGFRGADVLCNAQPCVSMEERQGVRCILIVFCHFH